MQMRIWFDTCLATIRNGAMLVEIFDVCAYTYTRTAMIMFGTLPSSAITFKREIVSSFPTVSFKYRGRYFSTLHHTKENTEPPCNVGTHITMVMLVGGIHTAPLADTTVHSVFEIKWCSESGNYNTPINATRNTVHQHNLFVHESACERRSVDRSLS